MPQNDLLPAILEAFALPPGPSIALLIFALLSRRPGSRRLFLILGLVSLYLCSIPVTSNWLMGRLEVFPPVSLEKIAAEAIVVLGSDRHREAKEYGGDTINGSGLERLRYAARLGKTTGLPILTSGGLARQDDETPEAELMGAALKEFGLEARWLEGNSRNTYENAMNSSRILKGMGIGEIVLVTHGFHMQRAVEAFEKAGMRVIPAPTGMTEPLPKSISRRFLPSASALQTTCLAWHELLGRWWYHYRYYNSASG